MVQYFRSKFFVNLFINKLAAIIRQLRYIFIIFFLFSFNVSKSTETDDDEGGLPIFGDIVPPSPTAAGLGQYGNIDVGLLTGTAQTSIPIYTLKSKQLSVPISLSYCSNGVKVDQVASWVGMGWNLNAGGVITRIVYDEPDDLSQWHMIDNLHVYTLELHDYVKSADTEGIDSQPDMFSFNFLGRTGKFIIDRESGEIMLIPYDNLKIEFDFVEGIKNIIITDEQGTKYYFGGDEAVEYTKTVPSEGGAIGSKVPVKTAWYLYRIEHQLGDYILFEYSSESYMYYSSFNQTLKATIGSDECSGGPYCPSVLSESISYIRSYIFGVNLEKISTSSGQSVVFNSENDRLDLPNAGRLDEINILDKNDIITRSFNFDYTYPKSTGSIHSELPNTEEMYYRMYLRSIQEFGINSGSKNPYLFEYVDYENLPPRFSFSQDHWGYYNGVNNTYFVPSDEVYEGLFGYNGGDRNPKSSSAKYGLLKKITYPTMGYTDMTFEGNSYWGTVTEEHSCPKTTLYLGVETDRFYNKIQSQTENTSVIPFTQDVPLNFSIVTAPCWETGDPEDKIVCTITIKDASDGTSAWIYRCNDGINKVTIETPVFSGADDIQNKYFVQLKEDRQYVVTLRISFFCLHATFDMSYCNQEAPPPTIFDANIETGGLRIAKIIDFDGTKEQVKKYYYNSYNYRSKSSGTIPALPIYLTNVETRSQGGIEGEGMGIPCETVCNFTLLHSNSQNNLYGFRSNHIFYPKVTVGIGENFQGGGTEHRFSIFQDIPSYPAWGDPIINAPYTNTGWKNGTKDYELYFKVVNGGKVNVKFIDFNYSEDNSKHAEVNAAILIKNHDFYIDGPYSFVLTEDYINYCYDYDCEGTWLTVFLCWGDLLLRCPWAGHQPGDVIEGLFRPNNYDISEYKIITGYNKLDWVSTTLYDANGNNGITTEEYYYYESPHHSLITRKERTDSNEDQITDKYLYPMDVNIQDENDCKYARSTSINQCYSTYHECIENNCSGYEPKSIEYFECLESCADERNFCTAIADAEYDDCLSIIYHEEGVLALKQMQNKHLVASQIEVQKLNENKLVDATLTEYNWQDGKITPSIVYTIESQSLLSNTSHIYVDQDGNLIRNSAYQPKIHFDSYDNFGNLTQYHEEKDNNTCFLWGYNSTYPIVKAENVDETTLRTAVLNTINQLSGINSLEEIDAFLEDIGTNSINKTLLTNFNEDLRENSLLSEALIYTYTYDPLVGMTSQTDPRGIQTYYEYDGFNRLKYIKDFEGNVLKRYEYNYAYE